MEPIQTRPRALLRSRLYRKLGNRRGVEQGRRYCIMILSLPSMPPRSSAYHRRRVRHSPADDNIGMINWLERWLQVVSYSVQDPALELKCVQDLIECGPYVTGANFIHARDRSSISSTSGNGYSAVAGNFGNRKGKIY
jgi:hypothetical protein